MGSITQTARARKSTLLYGFRISGMAKGYKPFALPTIFSPDVPQAWGDLKANEEIVSATLRRRGRVIEQYTSGKEAQA